MNLRSKQEKKSSRTSMSALNKIGKRVEIDGYTFDSQKEAQFYERFVKNSGFLFEIHPRFVLQALTPLDGCKLTQIAYTPDFIIKKPETGDWLHVIDVKNSFGPYGIDQGAKLRFKLFALKYKHPVEAVVIRKNDFKVITQSVSKMRNEKKPYITKDFWYHYLDATNY